MSEELVVEALVGEEAKKFFESDLGKIIVGYAEQEIQLAQEALETIDPTETEKIRQLQNQAKVARMFTSWLSELISKGENALQAFIQQKGDQ